MGLQVRVLQLTARQVSQMGLEVSEAPPERYVEYTNTRTGETMDVPVGVHPAFNYRPGLRRESLARALMDKADVAEPRTAARMLADGADQWAPLVQVEFNDFVGRYTGGERRTVGQRRVVGAFSSDQVDALLGAGQLRRGRPRHDSRRHDKAAEHAGRWATCSWSGYGRRRRARRAVADAVAPGR